MDRYVKFYAKYGMKRSNESFYKDKTDYLKLKVEKLDDAVGCYVKNTRTVMLDEENFDNVPMKDINATILHEFAHALIRDIFEGSEYMNMTRGTFVGNIDKDWPKEFEVEQLMADYLSMLYMGHCGNAKLLSLYELGFHFNDNNNPMDILNNIVPFRDKMTFNIEGLRRVNLDNDFLVLWLSNITGVSMADIRGMV